jgi:hydroxymethylpyrimidine kinase/phosphomethylpyrimidine kinase
LSEAAALVGAEQVPEGGSWETHKEEIRGMAGGLHSLGARGVLITGGHLAEPLDYLSLQSAGGEILSRELAGERVQSRSTHGTGCALATSIACNLAKGFDVPRAVAEAKVFVAEAIRHAYPLGNGMGPLNPLFRNG